MTEPKAAVRQGRMNRREFSAQLTTGLGMMSLTKGDRVVYDKPVAHGEEEGLIGHVSPEQKG
jgi:hypothetical protein